MPYKRGKKWVGKIEIDGNVIYCGTNHPTKTAAKDAETAKRKLIGKRNLGGMETCGSFAARWPRDYPYDKKGRKRRRSTIEQYDERISHFRADPDFRDLSLVEVTRPMLMRYAREHPGRAKAVQTLFSDAYNDGLIPVNHAVRLGITTKGKDEPKILTLEEFEHACETCVTVHGPEYGPRFRAMFEFAAWTAVRPGELFALTRAMLDVRGHVLRVREQVYRDGSRDTPKNHETREVVLPDQAIEAIRGLPLRTDGLLFSQKRGAPMNQGALSRDWQRVRDAIGRPDLVWYQATKHFCGSQLALAGRSPMEIGWQLGHTDNGETARKHYIHLYPREAHAAVLAGFRSRQGRNVVALRADEESAGA